MRQEAGSPLLPVTALPKIRQPAAAKAARVTAVKATQATAAKIAQAAAVRIVLAVAARRGQAKAAAHAAMQTPLTEAERLLLLKRTLTATPPSKGNLTSKNSS